MPEHFHLIIGRPEVGDTGKVLQVLKQRVSHGARKILGPTLSQKTGKDGAPSDVARSNPSEWEIVDPTLSQKTGKDGAPVMLRVPTRASGRLSVPPFPKRWERMGHPLL
jgi:hypothetical protein